MVSSILTGIFSSKKKAAPSSPEDLGADKLISELMAQPKISYLMGEIRSNISLLDSEYDLFMKPLIINVAKLVYDLQGSQHHHHSYLNGLFIHSLEVCNGCARSAGGLEFLGSEAPEVRKANAQKWVLAAGVAGLCHDLGKIVADLAVRNDEGKEWNPFVETLLDFKRSNTGANFIYRKSRKHKDHESFSLVLSSELLSTEIKAYLGSGDRRIIPAMLMAISGVSYLEVPLFFETLKNNDQNSTKASIAQMGGAPVISSTAIVEESQAVENENRPAVTVESACKQALLRLIKNGEYLVNVKDREKGLFWLDVNGLWMTWPKAFQAIEGVFDEDGFGSYPKQAGVFLSALSSSSMVEERDGSRSWAANITGDSLKIKLTLAKILDQELITEAKRMSKGVTVISPVGYDIEKEIASGIAGKTNNISFRNIENTGEKVSVSQESLIKKKADSAKVVSNGESLIKDQKSKPRQTKEETQSLEPKLNSKKEGKPPEKLPLKTKNILVKEQNKQGSDSKIEPNEISFSDDFNEYCENADEAGDVIFNIALAISNGKSGWFKSESKLLVLEWPQFSDYLGDDPVDIIFSLKTRRLLCTSGSGLNFNGDSTCEYRADGRVISALALSKLASTMILKELVNLPISTSAHTSNSNSNTLDKMTEFDSFVSQNYSTYRNKIRIKSEFECIEFKSMTVILNAMIENEIFKQEDRKEIYSFREEHNENIGCSYFKYCKLPKLSKVLKDEE